MIAYPIVADDRHPEAAAIRAIVGFALPAIDTAHFVDDAIGHGDHRAADRGEDIGRRIIVVLIGV